MNSLDRREYEQMRILDDAHQQYLLDYATDVDGAFQRGEVKGKMEGKIEGKIETALNMRRKGYQVSVIADVTGLPVEEVERLA